MSKPRETKPSGPVSITTKMIFLAAVVGLSVAGGLISGSLAAGLMFFVIGFFAFRGLSQGLTGGIATIIALVLAALVGPPIGHLLEPVIGSSLGVTGLAGRGVSLGLGGMVVFVVAAGVLRIVVRRALKGHKLVQKFDALAGAIAGGLIGVLVAFFFAWILLALAPPSPVGTPVAAAPAAAPAEGAEAEEAPTPNPALEAITRMAGSLRKTTIGAAAQATMPGEETRILALASDFAFVARDPVARQNLMDSEVMQQIRNLPSATAAADKAKADPQLRHIVEDGAITSGDIAIIANSPTITEIVDNTNFVQEVTPLLPQLEEAIRQAKASVAAKQGDNGGN
ncbi:MAG: hypothetical protein GC200_10600 [Tepidisphaera sp.]|nr:hypothetical protein [Tepidisphaera sp.]